MQAALQEARKAAARGEVPIGAVIVLDGKMIAAGRKPHPRTQRHHPPMRRSRRSARRRPPSATSVFREPISMSRSSPAPCVRLRSPSLAIRRLYYGAEDPKGGRSTRRQVLCFPHLPPCAGCLFRSCRAGGSRHSARILRQPTLKITSGKTVLRSPRGAREVSGPLRTLPIPFRRAGSASIPTWASARRPHRRGWRARSSRARSIRSGRSLPRLPSAPGASGAPCRRPEPETPARRKRSSRYSPLRACQVE